VALYPIFASEVRITWTEEEPAVTQTQTALAPEINPGDIDKLIAYFERGPGVWCKHALQHGSRRCVIGAMQHLGIQTTSVNGTSSLEATIVLAARQVTGVKHQSVPLFNDANATTYPILVQVLRRTRDIILHGEDSPIIEGPATRRDEPEIAAAKKRHVLTSFAWLLPNIWS